ncbi:MAG: TraB/GumN family protein [Bacteroidota bacterium]
MTRIARCIFFALLISAITFAQPVKKEFNSLLWKISGHGLATPSYVYGSMHLTDKRLFNFSDSLYYFLEHSDGFAAELDMGVLMPEIISELNGDKDSNTPIGKLVRNEWLAPYRKKLEKILQKNIEDITVRDLQKERSKFSNQLLRKGEMPTIMDVYLFDIAKRQGKWVGGIEDFEDQRKRINKEDEIMSMVDEITGNTKDANEKIEWMIQTYLSQDLDAIDLTNEIWKGAERDILIKRNTKMARRMDSIMKLRTCLFTVGAAHLPGDSGVVKLLRDRGFIVEPVYSSRKIEPGKYVYKAREIPWVKTDINEDWYSLLMPGKSEELTMAKDNASLAARLYYDMTRMNAYFSFGFPLAAGKTNNNDSIYKALAQNFSKEGKIISEKNITVNGTPGKEFVIKSRESDLRLQAFLPPSAMVLNMMAAYKYDSLFGNDASHFFESFHILKAAPAPPTMSWKTYSFPQQAFSIKFPLPYKEGQRDITADTIWKTHMYVANNITDNISYCVMTMDAKEGYYSDSDSAYFELMKKSSLERFKKDTAEWSRVSSFKGFPSYEFGIKMKYLNENLRLKTKLVNRGSRRYYIYAAYGDEESKGPKVDSFLNAFDFLPLEVSNWEYQHSPVKDISLWSPAAIHFQRGKDSSKSNTGYIIYDSVSPATIMIYKEYLSPYSWWQNDSTFFMQQAHRFLNENEDSLRDYKLIPDDKIPQADFSIEAKGTHNLKKVRLLLNGDTLYYVFAHLPADLLQSPDYTRLFNSIDITKKKPSGYHLANKTKQILRDMETGDPTSFEEAVDGLRDADFTRSDLPQLQKALLQPYRDYNSNMLYGAHGKLINKIVSIDDGTTLPYVKNNYASLKDSTEKLKYSFLYLLLKLKTKESYGLFEELIAQSLPSGGKIETLQYALTDSLELAASIFPDMLRLSTDTGFIKVLPFVANKLLDSGLVTTTSIEPYKKNFYALTEREIKRIKFEAQEYDYRATNLIKLLSHFKEPAAYQLLQQFLYLPAISTKKNAAIALVKNSQKTDPIELEKIAKDNYYRIQLYEELKEAKQEKLFPVKYYTQKLFAQSDVCQAASDDYDADSVIFIAEKTAMFRGKQEKFYLFKVVYNYEDEESEKYLGIAGPYAKVAGKIITRSDAGGVFRDEAFDPKKINAQLKEYLKQMEEYYVEEKE